MVSKIIRVTMMKIPSEESRTKFVAMYQKLSETAVKDGKPYILTLEAGPLEEDPRSNGFTFAAKSEFASKEDMEYYDAGCEAHQLLRAEAKELGIEGLMTIYYDPAVSKSL